MDATQCMCVLLYTYRTQSEHRAYVVVVLLDLLPEPHGLVVLRRVDVLGPPALHVVHPLAQELGSLRVDLNVRRFEDWFI